MLYLPLEKSGGNVGIPPEYHVGEIILLIWINGEFNVNLSVPQVYNRFRSNIRQRITPVGKHLCDKNF